MGFMLIDSRSLLETFKLAGTVGRGRQHATVGIDPGQRSAFRVIVEGAVGVAVFDPGALRFEQLRLARGRQPGHEGFVGFVQLDILALGFSADAFKHPERRAARLVHAGGVLFAQPGFIGTGNAGYAGNDERGEKESGDFHDWSFGLFDVSGSSRACSAPTSFDNSASMSAMLGDARQALLQGRRQVAQQLVLGHADGLVDARERIFGHQPVLLLAQQQADGRLVIRRLELCINGGQVEVELAGVLGLEGRRLEFDHHVALEARVIKKQFDEELVAGDLQPELPADKGKAGAQFQQEAGDMADQAVFDFALVGLNAQARAVIWQSMASAILPAFEQATGAQLAPGIKLLVRARPVFKAQYGFSLDIDAIDPDYTLGELEARKRDIRARLQAEGVFAANKQLTPPWDFNAVLVVAPTGGAGLGDFQAEADRLQSHGICRFTYALSRFQGEGAPMEIRHALQQALGQGTDTSPSPFDAVVILRGGGAVNDLAWLNDYGLARLICDMPIPVFTGIGHERDTTVLDEVAHARYDTPSKVIAGIE